MGLRFSKKILKIYPWGSTTPALLSNAK